MDDRPATQAWRGQLAISSRPLTIRVLQFQGISLLKAWATRSAAAGYDSRVPMLLSTGPLTIAELHTMIGGNLFNGWVCTRMSSASPEPFSRATQSGGGTSDDR